MGHRRTRPEWMGCQFRRRRFEQRWKRDCGDSTQQSDMTSDGHHTMQGARETVRYSMTRKPSTDRTE
eukprot:9761568-Alexandrium_andersonii.AAC.1